MGKVLSNFLHGYAGAISRSLDDVVVAMPNKSEGTIAFGCPVALDEDRIGIVPFDPATHTTADFLGITVRIPSKTPDTYGDSVGAYGKDELADVLVRGHIVVKTASNAAKLGDPVTIRKSDGAFSVETGDGFIALPNVHVSGATDSAGCMEVLLNIRNIL